MQEPVRTGGLVLLMITADLVEVTHIVQKGPVQIVTRGIFPGLMPSLIGISLYRLDESVSTAD